MPAWVLPLTAVPVAVHPAGEGRAWDNPGAPAWVLPLTADPMAVASVREAVAAIEDLKRDRANRNAAISPQRCGAVAGPARVGIDRIDRDVGVSPPRAVGDHGVAEARMLQLKVDAEPNSGNAQVRRDRGEAAPRGEVRPLSVALPPVCNPDSAPARTPQARNCVNCVRKCRSCERRSRH